MMLIYAMANDGSKEESLVEGGMIYVAASS